VSALSAFERRLIPDVLAPLGHAHAFGSVSAISVRQSLNALPPSRDKPFAWFFVPVFDASAARELAER
jgi:hypothetical protein